MAMREGGFCIFCIFYLGIHMRFGSCDCVTCCPLICGWETDVLRKKDGAVMFMVLLVAIYACFGAMWVWDTTSWSVQR